MNGSAIALTAIKSAKSSHFDNYVSGLSPCAHLLVSGKGIHFY